MSDDLRAARQRAHADIDALYDRLEQAARPANDDALVPISKCGLPRRSLRRLEATGLLKIALIGREKFVRKSDVLSLVDRMPAVVPPDPTDEPIDPLHAAHARALRRRAAAVTQQGIQA